MHQGRVEILLLGDDDVSPKIVDQVLTLCSFFLEKDFISLNYFARLKRYEKLDMVICSFPDGLILVIYTLSDIKIGLHDSRTNINK